MISERTAQLSRCHDVLNHLNDMRSNCAVHVEFLQSLINVLTIKKNMITNASVLMTDKMNVVIQRRTHETGIKGRAFEGGAAVQYRVEEADAGAEDGEHAAICDNGKGAIAHEDDALLQH